MTSNETNEQLLNAVASMRNDLMAAMMATKQDVAGIEASMANLQDERSSLANEVTPALLKQYEQVRKAKKGTALVLIVNNERCGGCNVKLPIHVLQKVSKGQEITRCPSCGRILWAK